MCEELVCDKREMKEPKWAPSVGTTSSQAFIPQIKHINKIPPKNMRLPFIAVLACSVLLCETIKLYLQPWNFKPAIIPRSICEHLVKSFLWHILILEIVPSSQ